LTRRWVTHETSDPQKVTEAEASNELPQILNDLRVDSFDGITTGDKSWFHYLDESLAMFAKLPGM
jgi:sugar lactone lactonase YvrE